MEKGKAGRRKGWKRWQRRKKKKKWSALIILTNNRLLTCDALICLTVKLVGTCENVAWMGEWMLRRCMREQWSEWHWIHACSYEDWRKCLAECACAWVCMSERASAPTTTSEAGSQGTLLRDRAVPAWTCDNSPQGLNLMELECINS